MLKDCIDRTYAIDHQIKADFYYLFSSADQKETSIDSAVACMHGFARCMPKVHEIKTVYAVEIGNMEILKEKKLCIRHTRQEKMFRRMYYDNA